MFKNEFTLFVKKYGDFEKLINLFSVICCLCFLTNCSNTESKQEIVELEVDEAPISADEIVDLKPELKFKDFIIQDIAGTWKYTLYGNVAGIGTYGWSKVEIYKVEQKYFIDYSYDYVTRKRVDVRKITSHKNTQKYEKVSYKITDGVLKISIPNSDDEVWFSLSEDKEYLFQVGDNKTSDIIIQFSNKYYKQ